MPVLPADTWANLAAVPVPDSTTWRSTQFMVSATSVSSTRSLLVGDSHNTVPLASVTLSTGHGPTSSPRWANTEKAVAMSSTDTSAAPSTMDGTSGTSAVMPRRLDMSTTSAVPTSRISCA